MGQEQLSGRVVGWVVEREGEEERQYGAGLCQEGVRDPR
jgi:hypothetical protein